MLRISVLGGAGMKSRLCAVSTAALLLVAMGSGDAARAAFVAAICNDAACSGGNDVIVTDNSLSDGVPGTGAISAVAVSPSAFGFSFIFNLAQSKNAAVPRLDLNFTVTGGSGTVYLYASDTDFTASSTAYHLSNRSAARVIERLVRV